MITTSCTPTSLVDSILTASRMQRFTLLRVTAPPTLRLTVIPTREASVMPGL